MNTWLAPYETNLGQFKHVESRKPLPSKSLEYSRLSTPFPAIFCYRAEGVLTIVDGLHRLEAARLRGDLAINVVTFPDKLTCLKYIHEHANESPCDTTAKTPPSKPRSSVRKSPTAGLV